MRDDKLSVNDFLSLEDEDLLFYLPLTQQTADEYFCFKDWILDLQRDPQAADSWHWPGKHSRGSTILCILTCHLINLVPGYGGVSAP